MIIFRSRLKQKRHELGLTQEALGKKIYLSKGEICAYEKGNRLPPLDVLIKLSNVLEVDFLWLIGLESSYKRENNRIINLSEIDVKIINALKNDSELYEKFIENPKRTVAQISNLINKK